METPRVADLSATGGALSVTLSFDNIMQDLLFAQGTICPLVPCKKPKRKVGWVKSRHFTRENPESQWE